MHSHLSIYTNRRIILIRNRVTICLLHHHCHRNWSMPSRRPPMIRDRTTETMVSITAKELPQTSGPHINNNNNNNRSLTTNTRRRPNKKEQHLCIKAWHQFDNIHPVINPKHHHKKKTATETFRKSPYRQQNPNLKTDCVMRAPNYKFNTSLFKCIYIQ